MSIPDTAELTKLKEQHSVTVKKHLSSQARVMELESALDARLDHFLGKFEEAEKIACINQELTDEVKYLNTQNERLENEVEKLRLRNEELEDKLIAKSKELKKADLRIEELEEGEEYLDDELYYNDETYTSEDYDVWNEKYQKEKKKRKAAEELIASKDNQILKLTAEKNKKAKIVIDLTQD